jgi:hypothetical protein
MKSRFKVLTTVLVIAAGVAVWGGMQVFAASSAAPASTAAPSKPKGQVAMVPGGARTLLRTYVNYEPFNGAAMPGGGTGPFIDAPTVISCHPPTTAPHQSCLLVVDETVQVGVSAVIDNRVWLFPYVDGVSFAPGNYLGNIPLVSGITGYEAFNWQDATIIPAGNHIVQTQVNSDFAASLGGYSLQYKVYWNHS